MITIDSVLSKKNVSRAMDFLGKRENGGGVDTDPLNELKEYWELNKEQVCDEIRSRKYEPGVINEYDIVNGKGKIRTVIRTSEIDRLITRLLTQKLNQELLPSFSERSHAYQEGKGIQTAVEQAKEYVSCGNRYVVEIDIRGFFDNINLEILEEMLEDRISDEAVLSLLKSYLRCCVSNENGTYRKSKGILQGLSISPILSNLYLDNLDKALDKREYNWVRFADDINVYVRSMEEGADVYSFIREYLSKVLKLEINEEKSGTYDAFGRRYLGFDFRKKGKDIVVEKHSFKKKGYFREWHPCVVKKVNKEYHLVQSGTLNKQDYSLLFENENEKHHIPVEATDNLNVYNEVILTSSVISTLYRENITMNFYDRFGEKLGSFIPENKTSNIKTMIKQCLEYEKGVGRLNTARKMEIAAMHNIRSNLRYYKKQGKLGLDEAIEYISKAITNMNEAKSVEELLLIEAQGRQRYYQTFNLILKNSDFDFEKRTRRPPKDRINALISFGNTLLYNRIQQIIWHSHLDSRIGIFHAANKRQYSLNLDFADLFKPIIIDRIIFSMINRGQINKDMFEEVENGGIYLNDEGKRLFLRLFEEKMNTKINVGKESISYHKLVENEIRAYQEYIDEEKKYAPYKYY